MDMHPNTARTFWKSLVGNASGLIADPHALLERGSFGRARSLTVLAQEGWDLFFAKKRSDTEKAGKQANKEKMAGFYVDLDSSGEAVISPADVSAGTIADGLQTAAPVVEMLLIKDHSRMKLEATTPYDGTHEQQHRLLPISHPEGWAAASQEFRDGGYFKGGED